MEILSALWNKYMTTLKTLMKLGMKNAQEPPVHIAGPQIELAYSMTAK